MNQERLVTWLRRRRNLWLLFAAGFAIRLVLAATSDGLQFDVLLFQQWAGRLADRGPGQFYEPGYFVDYPPGYLYVLLALGKVSQVVTGGAPPVALLKLPAIAADLGVALLASALAMSVTPRTPSQRRTIGIVAAAAILFNPALILLSAVWGQVDSILALLVMAGIYVLTTGRPSFGREAMGIGLLAVVVATKPQAVFALPVVAVVLIHRHLGTRPARFAWPALVRLIALMVFGYIVIAMMFLPFGVQPAEIPGFYRAAGSVYPFTSLWAFNGWGVVGFYRPDIGSGAVTVAGVPAFYFGLILFAAVTIAIAARAWQSLARGAQPTAVAVFGFVAVTCAAFALLTRSHERYLYLAVAGLASFVTVRPLRWAFLVLSISYFLNLHFVYVYFSQHSIPPGSAWTIQPLYDALFGSTNNAWQLKFLSGVIATMCGLVAAVGWRWLERHPAQSASAPLPHAGTSTQPQGELEHA
jgi:dolichyl-phosphate-mannose-protein mannosyltransferase